MELKARPKGRERTALAQQLAQVDPSSISCTIRSDSRAQKQELALSTDEYSSNPNRIMPKTQDQHRNRKGLLCKREVTSSNPWGSIDGELSAAPSSTRHILLECAGMCKGGCGGAH